MPTPKQILSGEVKYGLEELYPDLKEAWYKDGFKSELNEKEKNEQFKTIFMFIMLAAEDRSVASLSDAFNGLPTKVVEEMLEAFDKEIDVARHIHMRKYLDIYSEYGAGVDITLKLVNKWIHDFVDKHIKEDENGIS